MAKRQNGTVLRQLCTLFDLGAVAGLSDGQLLERFSTRNGETAEWAFSALVERHGPMVLRTCRAVLRDEHEAQDGFQATFLILARKARTLRVRDSLGPWLHEVAYRVASCGRSVAARRRRHERRAAEMRRHFQTERRLDDQDQVLHDEIHRLPERYRAAVILCGLEGLTTDQAAQRLGWPVGTVRSRLARGRDRLRDRLTRRGLAPSVTLLGVMLSAEATSATVPAALAKSAVQSATHFTVGKVAAGVVSAPVGALVKRGLRNMVLTRLLRMVAFALTAGTLAIATGGLTRSLPGGGGGVLRAAMDEKDASRGGPLRSDLDQIQGDWFRVSTDGRKDDRIIKMSVKKARGEPRLEIPEGAGEFLFDWKTEGENGGSWNRVMLDPTRSPRTLDFFPEQKGAPRVCPGIYQLEGDTLTICFLAIEGKRPSEFVPKPRQGWTLDVYKRRKP